ncbi:MULTISPECIES: hypothetical protein [Sporosarcina]|uniref:hypothetical protein n=1 Tax=Sporosarcina TaxID=1569 RepID=UPI00129AF0EB|nr:MULTISPECIES: hypothetical protein [Sporosarcina]GLB57525.1 hypothetical protein NCCP2378_33140 [Sporosarcina sp. NCCP-2378]
MMNDQDIWVAEVHEEDGQWAIRETFQMNGPFEDAEDVETVFVNEEPGYEMGYIQDGIPVPDDAEVFEFEGVFDWKIWFMSSLQQ